MFKFRGGTEEDESHLRSLMAITSIIDVTFPSLLESLSSWSWVGTISIDALSGEDRQNQYRITATEPSEDRHSVDCRSHEGVVGHAEASKVARRLS